VLDLPGSVPSYLPGTWGPDEARRVLAGDDGWHDPQPETVPPC
jgi:glucose-6-phosphate 1-dehydrogenase